jgi:hypothetical protein
MYLQHEHQPLFHSDHGASLKIFYLLHHMRYIEYIHYQSKTHRSEEKCDKLLLKQGEWLLENLGLPECIVPNIRLSA